MIYKDIIKSYGQSHDWDINKHLTVLFPAMFPLFCVLSVTFTLCTDPWHIGN